MSDALLDRYGAVLLDLDGTVYHGSRPIPGAVEAVSAARERGVAVRYVTNNASKSPDDVAGTLTGMGLPAEATEVRTSSQAAGRLLAQRLPAGATVLVVGARALEDEVLAAGLRPVREAGEDVTAVVQGHSPDTGWVDLAEACLAVRAGALWVAANVDATLPAERGLLPGNGSMVAALRTATDSEPLVAGKPAPPLFHAAAADTGVPLVVGDRLDTDIAGGIAAGYDTLVVLTGVATPASVLAAVPGERAHYIAADLGALGATVAELAVGPQPGWDVAASGGTLTVSGDGGPDDDPLALLRALCSVGWRDGTTTVRPSGDAAAAALDRLGLG
ncbi:HAD family hydrolase [Amycolatopsis antarctica]|uniref:HAD family hydrolase n=1 Tax=Amycolatopsis antarctica TaxID=1854586 RepID=A0A263CXP3_9PSEU|nr:HAD-IIA family hydrolase [Amycolatopsis antarctica]OZM70871.1 HAD family hydrolase [Amycolatopsis antarctica]